ncbi:MAG: glycosyl transferase [Acetatifactor sp.]|nr:glycosyl transferase [Acetatifactor sp.]
MLKRNIIHRACAKLFWMGVFDWLPEIPFIKFQYWARMGEKLNLSRPELFSEKLAWLKLYNQRPEYSTCVDKYAVKEYVSKKIGAEYIIPLLGVWDKFEDIDFGSLPDQFVLKCTHDCGSICVCKDKNNFDFASAKEKITKAMRKNYYVHNKEWAYKNVVPRIIAEKYVDSLGNPESLEYKVSCFNGKVEFITFCRGIAHASLDVRTNDHYDRDFNRLNWYAFYKNSNIQWKKPEQWDKLIELSEKLAKDIPYVRVDWYVIDGEIFFGEMTFYTWGGYLDFEPSEWNKKLGDMIDLPDKITREYS